MFMMEYEQEVVSRKGHQTGSGQQEGHQTGSGQQEEPSDLTGFRKSTVAMGVENGL